LHPPESLNRVPASVGGRGWNVTSAGCQVTLCDPIWHVNSSSGVATLVSELLCAISVLLYLLLYFTNYYTVLWSLYGTTCVSRRPQLRTGRFCWSRVLLSACPCWWHL